MQRSRRSNGDPVPSVHESAEMLAACGSRGEKSRGTEKQTPEGPSGSRRNGREETPRTDVVEMSEISSLEVAEQPSRKTRGVISLGSLNSFGGATPGEEIDLTSPPNRKRACIGAARASQARLFGLTPGSLGFAERRSKRKKTEADYDPLYMQAVRNGLANAAKAQEAIARKEAQASQKKPLSNPVQICNKDTQVNETELGIQKSEVSVQTTNVSKKGPKPARKPVKGAAQLVREANKTERRSTRNCPPSEEPEAVRANADDASGKEKIDNRKDSRKSKTSARALEQVEESGKVASPPEKDTEDQENEEVLECPPGQSAPTGSLEVLEHPSAVAADLPEFPEENPEVEQSALAHSDACEEDSVSEHERAVNAAVKLLKGRLLGLDGWKGMQRNEGVLPLTGELREHHDKLYTLLAETVENGLNVSALLLGPRGNRKTTVVERVVHDLQEAFGERVSVVRLNGLVHSDERIALKEIARQLCEDNELAVSKVSTFELNLRFLTDVLTECVKAHRAVVFVLEEFDLFAQRPKQTLLYNLLDAIQSSKTQAAVVGISCRLDADELLEKRVRSRFSHRRIQFLEPPVPELLNLLSDNLHLPPSFPHADFAARFNEKAEAVLADPDVQAILDSHVSYNQTPRHILDLGFRALCNMGRTRGHLTVEDFESARAVMEAEPRVESIKGLSVLELYLLIAMKRLEEKERDKYNFQMVFAEYQEARHQHTADQYTRGVSLRAFQHLIGRELVTFADRRPRSDPMEFRPVKLLVDAAEIEKGLKGHPQRSSALEQWFANKAAGKF